MFLYSYDLNSIVVKFFDMWKYIIFKISISIDYWFLYNKFIVIIVMKSILFIYLYIL